MRPLITGKRRLRVMGFTSGSGNTLWKAWELQKELERTAEGCPYEIVGIFSDCPQSRAVELAESHNLPAVSIDIRKFYEEKGRPLKDRETRKEYDGEALKLFAKWQPDLIMLAGYVWAVTEVITDRYLLLNIHPGDLTCMREGRRILAGANGIKAAFRERHASLRASSHIVTGQVDGGPLLLTSPAVPVDYSLHTDEEERFRYYLKLVNEQSRLVGARTLLELALGHFETDGGGNYYYRGMPAPQGLKLESWEEYQPGCLIDKRTMLSPESIAVLGASAKPGIGRAIVENIVNQGFGGRLYAVNLRGEDVETVKAAVRGYRTVAELPETPDMAIVALPAVAVPEIARACGERGVRSLVCVSAGFRETGTEGAGLERELLSILRRYSMCMLGPNCMGIINTDSRVRLNATILANPPRPGNVAMVTQSGALGAAFLDFAGTLGIGYSAVVSTGNQADLNVCDFLPYLEEDPNTKVIFLYLEEISEPQRFRRLAGRMTKPIVAVKSGRTAAGAAAAGSHTGSLAGNDAIADALLRQAGVIRAATLEEGFLLTAALAKAPRLKGRRVGVLSNTGGLGILAADVLTEEGFTLPQLGADAVGRLAPRLLPEASLRNPMDLVAPARPEQYAAAAREMLESGLYDALLFTCVPAATVETGDIGTALETVFKSADIPVLACFFAPELGAGGRERMRRAGIPVFDYPETMVKVLGLMALGSERTPGNQTASGSEMTAQSGAEAACKAAPGETHGAAMSGDRGGRMESSAAGRTAAERIFRQYQSGYLKPQDCCAVLEMYGIPMAKSWYLERPGTPECQGVQEHAGVAKSPETPGAPSIPWDFGDTAPEFLFPLAAKIDHPEIVHKSDAGGVRLNIRSLEELRALTDEWSNRFEGLRGIFLQEQAEAGPELILGGVRDASVGHGILVGLGGTLVELLKDVSFGHVPVNESGAKKMLKALRAYPLLEGYRGKTGVNLEMLESCIIALSHLLTDFPIISELDINPLIYEKGKGRFVGVDARIRIDRN